MKQLIIILCFLPLLVNAQKAVRQNLREGNAQYKNEKFTESDVAYRKALEINPESPEANYNLANSMYKQKKYKEAGQQYEATVSKIKDPKQAFAVYHNLGNCQMQAKEYFLAISSYQQALRINPYDNETRYNLALSKALLKNQLDKQSPNEKEDEADKILKRAKEMVAQRRYLDAYNLMKEGETKYKKLLQSADFTKRISEVVNMNL